MKLEQFQDEFNQSPIELLEMAELIRSKLEQTSTETLAVIEAAQAFIDAHDALLIEMNEVNIELG